MSSEATHLDWLEQEYVRLEPSEASLGVGVTREYAGRLHDLATASLAQATQFTASRVAVLAEFVAAHLTLVGDPLSARRLLQSAAGATDDALHRAQIEETMAHPAQQLALVHGRWLVSSHRFADAERVLAPLAHHASHSATGEVARRLLETPRPVQDAPRLFSIRGCGQAMYFPRDEHADGTCVMTLCAMIGGFPIYPRRAFRLRSRGEHWEFLAEVPLTPQARAAQRFGGGALIAVAATFVVALLIGLARNAAA